MFIFNILTTTLNLDTTIVYVYIYSPPGLKPLLCRLWLKIQNIVMNCTSEKAVINVKLG